MRGNKNTISQENKVNRQKNDMFIMKEVVPYEEKIEILKNYYKDDGLLIVGLNDSQGVNTTSTVFKKGLLENIKDALTSKELTPTVINAFSLIMNKTEHIEYFLKNNLSVEEIKLSQVYGAVSAFEKVMRDIGLPEVLGKIGYTYKSIYKVRPEDENIRITSALKEAKEPVMIYSSGVNDLMREVGANPFGIKKDYKNRFIKENYYYAKEKSTNAITVKKVVSNIEQNFKDILDINSNKDIFALGAYVPKSLQFLPDEDKDIFRNLIIFYNEELFNLCRNYGITYIDTERVGKKYNTSNNNFHISSVGHVVLSTRILNLMYQRKFELKNKKVYPNNKMDKTSWKDSHGALGVIDSLEEDYKNIYKKA